MYFMGELSNPLKRIGRKQNIIFNMLLEVHHKQVITYLKLSGLKLGLLVNLNVIDKSVFLKVNNLSFNP